MSQLRIPAMYLRGGTSKGVFFDAVDLPADPAARDRLLLRITGSPDPYGKQIDGMGGATSSTSKVVIISKSQRPGFDVDYLFGAVAIGTPSIDWSGNCGNLTAAVGLFAIERGLVVPPSNGIASVRIWQVNIGKPIVAHVPVQNGHVVEEGDFRLDGVPFPSAETVLDFLEPAGGAAGLLPTGKPMDELEVPTVGRIAATLIDAGNPTIIVRAADMGLEGTEGQKEVNGNPELLARCEAVRVAGAVAMGLAQNGAEAAKRPHTPKLAMVAAPKSYRASSGVQVEGSEVDLLLRIISMGTLHHAITGTGGVALAVAAVLPGTLAYEAVKGRLPVGARVRIGHPSGTMTAGATIRSENGEWNVEKVTMSRSARCLMEGWVRVPAG